YLRILVSANLTPSLPLLSLTTDLSLSLSVSAEAQKLPYYAGYGHVRLMIHSLCTSHYLDLFITLIICINVITMSLEHYDQPKVRTAPMCLPSEDKLLNQT
ncbi:voltage-dependent T-type calcium channel subunit alpha-1I isoform X1, partial [Tachysurus ichikawai]